MIIRVGDIEVDSHELQTDERQKWLASLHKKKIEIRCTCNPNATMHIRRSKSGRYSIKTNPNRLQEHNSDICDIRLELSERQLKGQHYRAVEVVSETEFNLSTKHLNLFIHNKGSNDKAKPNKRTVNLTQANVTNSGITLGSLGRELLSRAWEKSILSYQETGKFYPSIRGLQYQLNELFVKGAIRVNLTNKLTLDKVLWLGNTRPGTVYFANTNDKLRPIVLCPLNKASVRESDKEEHVLFEGENLKGEAIQFEVNEKDWNNAATNCRVSFKDHHSYFIIGLALYQGKDQPLLLERLELIPVTLRGMFVDSSYENRLFSKFERHHRIYTRPNQRIEALNNYLPDAMLLDTEKPCIVEVFGMSEANKGYHEAKDRKMLFYSTLKEHYLLYYWHAYRTNKIPELPVTTQ
ncbi:hypothetical protein [Solibacillus sp. NPDC093137]|uniref:hypothetical protein n=1 Tax=Solibacillus sp. NPDC093137 TaxID=3390678 RepID=UPI003D036571